MNDYDDDFMSSQSDEWKEIAGDDVGIISQTYPVPEGSDAVAEVRKCVEFCKAILT